MINNRMINLNKEKLSKKERLNLAQDIINKEPYYNQNYMYDFYFKELDNSKLSTKELDGYYDFIINKLNKIKTYSPYFINTLYTREKIIYKEIKSLENTNYEHKDKYIKRLTKLLVKEHDKYLKYFKDIDRNNKPTYIASNLLKEYNKIYNEVK